jgi:glycerol-3-phosphate dehydrogenase
MGIKSPYRHIFSKGVYLALPPCGEEERRVATIYPMPGEADVLTHVPWGPVMMWGPTETAVRDLEPALSPDRDDLHFLLSSASRCLSRRVGAEEIISVRCGVRPLAVRKDYAGNDYPLELSRRHRVFADKEWQAVAVYGGKLTSGLTLAEEVALILEQWSKPRYPKPSSLRNAPETSLHPALNHDLVTAAWSRDHEFCVTLEDYLRRRTPLAQWIPRMGLGRSSEHRKSLEQTAAVFAAEGQTAASLVDAYEKKICETYDPLLNSL